MKLFWTLGFIQTDWFEVLLTLTGFFQRDWFEGFYIITGLLQTDWFEGFLLLLTLTGYFKQVILSVWQQQVFFQAYWVEVIWTMRCFLQKRLAL